MQAGSARLPLEQLASAAVELLRAGPKAVVEPPPNRADLLGPLEELVRLATKAEEPAVELGPGQLVAAATLAELEPAAEQVLAGQAVATFAAGPEVGRLVWSQA